jgi:hypothetical protein
MKITKKQIPTTDTGLYDSIDNILPLPDEWNGLRWLNYKIVGTKDRKLVTDIYNSYKKYGILCAFDSVIIPETFYAKLDGVMTEYTKGKRMLVDENRRYKGVTMAIGDGYEIVTPSGKINELPINDLTETIKSKLGTINNMKTDGKEKIFKILMILNFGGKEFSDEEVITGGAECVVDIDEKAKFTYLKRQLKTYCVPGGLTIKLALKAILGRDKLKDSEKEELKIDYNMADTDISTLNLKAALKIKKDMGGQAPAPFINILFGEVHNWLDTKYFLGQEREQISTVNKKTGIMGFTYNVLYNPDKKTYFVLDDEKDINLYKKYLNSIVNYITVTWKKELDEDNEKLSGETATALRNIQERVKDMWEEYLT